MSTVLITGANRGLGLEFTRQYASDGWQAIACCRAPEKASDLQALAQSNPAVRVETLDIADNASIASLATRLKDTPVDILINNAGISSGVDAENVETGSALSQAFGTIDSEAWAKVFRINTIAPVMVTQALKQNLELGSVRKVVMISSRMGSIERLYREDDIAYRTSKAALNAAMRSLSFSLKKDKISIVSFHPGWVKTDMGGQSADLTPEESVRSMRQVISTFTPGESGLFFNYDGQILPW